MQPGQSTAFSIMNKAAMAFDNSRSSVRRYVKEFVVGHSVSEEMLIQAINDCTPSILIGRSADIEVGLLIQDKSLEVLDGVCTWKTTGSSPSKRARKNARWASHVS